MLLPDEFGTQPLNQDAFVRVHEMRGLESSCEVHNFKSCGLVTIIHRTVELRVSIEECVSTTAYRLHFYAQLFGLTVSKTTVSLGPTSILQCGSGRRVFQL